MDNHTMSNSLRDTAYSIQQWPIIEQPLSANHEPHEEGKSR